MRLKHFISTKQFANKSDVETFFKETAVVEKRARERLQNTPLSGKILASLFYEPSTRTRFSFEAAMMKLGGGVISTENAAQFSSAAKGETLEDTVRVVGGFADAIVLRHPEEGASGRAARVACVPVVSAGDGAGEHPTQALLDAYTIYKRFGRIDNLSIAFMGDLLYGRTVHSLIYLLPLWRGMRFYCISPTQLGLPKIYREHLAASGTPFKELSSLAQCSKEIDVLYVTRIQTERFTSEKTNAIIKNSYRVDTEVLADMKKDLLLMHPLPRLDEISQEVDDDPRAGYFVQAENGLYIRMALLLSILEEKTNVTWRY